MDGQPVHLEVVLWRDVQPGVDEGPLAIIVSLAADREAVFEGLSVEEVTLDYGSESWTGSRVEEACVEPFERQYTLRGGPRWPISAVVDVTVKLRTLAGTEMMQLKRVQVREPE